MGFAYSTAKNNYDWKPELPDFRDEVFKYPKNNSKIPATTDLRSSFKEYNQNFGSSAATSIASILDSYNLRYTFDNSDIVALSSIRNCIKKFKILDQKTLKYTKLSNFKNTLRQSLSDGYPIIFGFTIYESFESEDVKKTGIVKNPSKDEKILGGLCAVIVGYDGDNHRWIVKHPFGKEFGDNGYIYIPFDILAKNNNLTSDFWRITYV
jgi:C1A family cysteine protease